MADKQLAGAQADHLLRNFHDNGDGTWSETITATVTGGVAAVAQGASTDKSGTVAAGGTAQSLAAAKADRRYLFVQNNSAGDLWIRFGGTAAAVQPSIRLQPGDAWVEDGTYVNPAAVSIFGATTAQTFSAMEA